ncbi:uncharacterized protein ISCGN_028533 [Ixodes scapularis]
MALLTSSWATASLLFFVLLVKQGAGVQPECKLQEFYNLYSSVVGNLRFRVTGTLNTPYILQGDCDALKNVTQRVDTFLEGCTADNNEDLKKRIRGLRLARDSLCGSELEDDLNLWQDCFDANVFAECKKNVEERLRKLEQDGALEAAGDFSCRNESLGFQCALKAGAGCPEKAERARKAVENYINLLMDVKTCRRPAEYACEGDLFDHCYWMVMSGPAARLPLLPSDAETLSKYCKAAKSAPTCTRNLQIEQCPEERKKILGTIEDGFRSIPDSICNEELPASVEEWNKCLDPEALVKCMSEIPRPNLTFVSEADVHVHFCRDREEKLKCELAAGSNCPSSASVAKKALYELRTLENTRYNCTRPKIDGYGGSGFSTTPAILVTLSALCVALLPLKQTLLRDFN